MIAVMVDIEVLGHATIRAHARATGNGAGACHHANGGAAARASQIALVPSGIDNAATDRSPVRIPERRLDIVDRGRTDMTDGYLGYSTWCRSKGLRPLEVEDFFFGMLRL